MTLQLLHSEFPYTVYDEPCGLEMFALWGVWQISEFVKHLVKLCGFHFSRSNFLSFRILRAFLWPRGLDLKPRDMRILGNAITWYWEKCLKLRKCAYSFCGFETKIVKTMDSVKSCTQITNFQASVMETNIYRFAKEKKQHSYQFV